MSKKEKIEKSLIALKKSIESLPDGDLKEDAEGAIKFLSQVVGGAPVPYVISCFGVPVAE